MDFFHSRISSKAIKLVTQVLQSTFISEGKKVEYFEKELFLKLGFVNPVALNSGTAALHLALVVAGIKPGDEVILPAQTFVATGTAVLQQLAVPVFADIENGTGNINVDSIKEKMFNL